MAGSFYLGTSGYAYDAWKHGIFYPEGLKNREMLSYYSGQLSSVEINYTFRRFPTEKSLLTWREEAQPGFVFTLKANQRITHFKRLEDVDDDVRAFLEVAKTLGDRLGCILFQCPPTLQYRRELIEAFVGYLPPAGPGVPRFAMEFRHPSWKEAKDLLLSQGVAWCVAETDEQDPKPADLSWEPAGYLRLRKTEYTDNELRAWADRIAPALAAGSDVFCYFKHEDGGASPKMAKRLVKALTGDDREVLATNQPHGVDSGHGEHQGAEREARDYLPSGVARPDLQGPEDGDVQDQEGSGTSAEDREGSAGTG